MTELSIYASILEDIGFIFVEENNFDDNENQDIYVYTEYNTIHTHLDLHVYIRYYDNEDVIGIDVNWDYDEQLPYKLYTKVFKKQNAMDFLKERFLDKKQEVRDKIIEDLLL